MKKENNKQNSKDRLSKEMNKAEEIADYYGFSIRKPLDITKADLEQAKNLLVGDFINPDLENEEMKLPLHVEEKITILRNYFEEKLNHTPQPVMMFFGGSFKGQLNKKADKFNRFCDLEIIGTEKSIAEATLIQTANIILREAGFDNLLVEINSMGDKDSINAFYRDLTSYYKKCLNELCADCRQLMKKDAFEILACKKEHCRKLNSLAPKSINYLSDRSRNHFREILEYLESLGIPFRINNNLLGNRQYCTEAIYEIITENGSDRRTLALGIRYDGLSKKIGLKKDTYAAGISILAKANEVKDLDKQVKRHKTPLVYFLQLGFDAKLLSLKIIEVLRQNKISVYQALSRDKLTSQMAIAEKMNIPYTVIIGKKEALDNTAIVKVMNNHSQETVGLDNLGAYIRKLIGK